MPIALITLHTRTLHAPIILLNLNNYQFWLHVDPRPKMGLMM